MMQRWILFFATLALAGFAGGTMAAGQGTGPAVDPPTGNMLFILDASGSMWGRVEEVPKITVAKDVMSRLVDELPAGTRAGLIAYGHRSKGDCADIETLVPLGSLDRELMKAKIEGLNALGMTPLTASVQQAVEQLRQVEESATIVLVSDGLESCGGDPCEAVKAAREAGVAFRLDVVGFDLADADTSQLQCMADAGGGRFYTANNAHELTEALQQTVGESEPAPPAMIDVGFTATDGEDGPVIRRDLAWTVVPVDGDKPAVEDFDVAELKLPLAPGEYRVAVRRSTDDAGSEQTIEVADGQPQAFVLPIVSLLPSASISAVASAEMGASIPVDWTGPDAAKDYIAVVKPGAPGGSDITFAYTKDGSPLKLKMPPDAGDYELVYVRNEDRVVLAREPIKVTAVQVSVSAVASAAVGAVIPVTWTGPDYDKDYIAVVKPGGGGNSDITYTYTKEGSPLELKMPAEPGDYELVYVLQQDHSVLVRVPITATAVSGSIIAVESAAAGSTIPVTWTGPDYDKDYIAVVKPGGGGKSDITFTYTKEGSPLELKMPPEPGDYELVYVLQQDHSVLVRVPITATAVSGSIIAVESAAAGSTIPVTWTGPDYHKDYIAVVKPGGGGKSDITFTYTKEGSPLELKMPPEPGDYELVYVLQQDHSVLVRVPITATPVSASISAPGSGVAAASIPVTWTGPDYDKDYIAVVKPGGSGKSDITYAYTRTGSPLNLKLPDEPGDYELVYVQDQGSKIVLAREPITVTGE